MNKPENESFVRWQGRTIEQLNFVNNLLIVIAIGFIVFISQLAFDEKVLITPYERFFLTTSIIFMSLSLLTSCALAINRLMAFRNTTKIARKRASNDRSDIQDLRNWTDEIDSRTWNILWCNFVLFGLGSLSLLASVLIRLLA